MCGIAGFYNHQEKDDGVRVLRRMLTRIKHRGPDQSGFYLSKEVGLGSVRLSIIDLTTGGMPLSNEDNSLWIVFNGEIFNYIELKRELVLKGHIFRTTSDTEVILHAYEEYGSGCLNKFNGQFAIAIWDEKTKELFLARDRVGIRPLYYTQIDGGLIFASEIKSIFEYPGVATKISSKALAQVFTFWTTITPDTIFENIFELKPGSFMKISHQGMVQKQYWELPVFRPDEYLQLSLTDAVDSFRELFKDAVRIRLRADVPVGAYLSGGIDSSVTTSFIKTIIPENLRTFSIGFADDEFDETSFQDIAVKYFKTRHTYIKCYSEKIAEKFPDVIWHAEIPLLRTAPIPMYLLSKLVRENDVKVVITGEGADEILGGYNIFKEAVIREFWARDPQSRYRPLLLKKLYPYLPQMQSQNPAALKMFFGFKLEETGSPVYSHLLRWNNTSRLKHYLTDDIKQKNSDYDPVGSFAENLNSKFEGVDLISRAQWLEINLFLSGYLLTSQGDRMAMANSVEGRYPFLDYRVIEYCMKLPPAYKLHGLNEKYLLKKMMQGHLPEEILNRSKQAYRAPIKDAFGKNNIPDYVDEMFSVNRISNAGIFNSKLTSDLFYRLKNQRPMSEIDNMAIVAVLSTQLIDYLYVQKKGPVLNEAELVNCDIEYIRDVT